MEEKSRNPSLKHLILLDSFGEELKEKAAKEGISVHRFDDVLTMGRQIDKSHFEVKYCYYYLHVNSFERCESGNEINDERNIFKYLFIFNYL